MAGRRTRPTSPIPLAAPDLKQTAQTVFPLTSLETASVRKKEQKKTNKQREGGSGEFHAYPDIGMGLIQRQDIHSKAQNWELGTKQKLKLHFT